MSSPAGLSVHLFVWVNDNYDKATTPLTQGRRDRQRLTVLLISLKALQFQRFSDIFCAKIFLHRRVATPDIRIAHTTSQAKRHAHVCHTCKHLTLEYN